MYICVCVHTQRLLPLLSGLPEYVDILHNGLFVSGAVQHSDMSNTRYYTRHFASPSSVPL